MSILSMLYGDCSSFCDRMSYNDSFEYKKISKEAEKLEEKLYTYFGEDLKFLYEEVRMAQLQKDSIEEERIFKKAFSFGALLMLEIMGEFKDGI